MGGNSEVSLIPHLCAKVLLVLADDSCLPYLRVLWHVCQRVGPDDVATKTEKSTFNDQHLLWYLQRNHGEPGLTRCRWAPAWCQEEGWWGRRTACSDGRSFRLEEERAESIRAAQEASDIVLYVTPRQHRNEHSGNRKYGRSSLVKPTWVECLTGSCSGDLLVLGP